MISLSWNKRNNKEETTPTPSLESLFGPLEALSLLRIAQIIGVKKIEDVKKWLKNHDIPTHRNLGKGIRVFKVDLDIVLDRTCAQNLMHQHPKTWENRYRIIARSPQSAAIVVGELTGELEQS